MANGSNGKSEDEEKLTRREKFGRKLKRTGDAVRGIDFVQDGAFNLASLIDAGAAATSKQARQQFIDRGALPQKIAEQQLTEPGLAREALERSDKRRLLSSLIGSTGLSGLQYLPPDLQDAMRAAVLADFPSTQLGEATNPMAELLKVFQELLQGEGTPAPKPAPSGGRQTNRENPLGFSSLPAPPTSSASPGPNPLLPSGAEAEKRGLLPQQQSAPGQGTGFQVPEVLRNVVDNVMGGKTAIGGSSSDRLLEDIRRARQAQQGAQEAGQLSGEQILQLMLQLMSKPLPF